MKRERSAEGVDQLARRRRIVEILHDNRQSADFQRDRVAHQDQQDAAAAASASASASRSRRICVSSFGSVHRIRRIESPRSIL